MSPLRSRSFRRGATFIALTAVVGAGLWLLTERWAVRQARSAHLTHGATYRARDIERTGRLPRVLRESSGVAVSRINEGVLWSHNDSGDAPQLYAIDITGRLLATVSLDGASAIDWEDIAAAPCPRGSGDVADTQDGTCLYVADTGNNNLSRSVLTIYVVREPRLDGPDDAHTSVPARAVSFSYPGQTDDCEALAVTPNGDIILVSKGRAGTIGFFRLPAGDVARALATGERLTARHDGDTGIAPDPRIGRLVTGAAFSSNDATLAVRTYSEVFFYRANHTGTGAPWTDLHRPCFIDGGGQAGEAIDYLDNEWLVLTSEAVEDRRGAVYRLRC